jgi:hypothetical protein
MPAPESTECFIEDQAFLRSYDSAPLLAHPLFLSSPVSKLPLFSVSCESSVELTDGRWGGGGGRGAKPYDREKAWLSINHSILSGLPGALPPKKLNQGRERGTAKCSKSFLKQRYFWVVSCKSFYFFDFNYLRNSRSCIKHRGIIQIEEYPGSFSPFSILSY